MIKIKKYLLFIIGTTALILGTIGVFIPVLPTTPFLLITSFCYLRCSKRLYNWVINHKVFGKYINDYVTHKAIKKNNKIAALTFMWLSMGITIYLIKKIYLSLFLIFISILVSIHILKLKTLSNE